MAQSVLVLERNAQVATSLIGGLQSRFAVHIIGSREELQDGLARQPEAVVLNIEYWRLTDVESLHREFPALPIVCTHRVPDEEMWMAALEAGASDVCAADDVADVLMSILRNGSQSRTAAA